MGVAVSHSSNFSALFHGEYAAWLVKGVITTLQLFGVAWIAGFAIALLLVMLRASPFRPLQHAVALYVAYHRNVPLVVQILCWYFAVPEMLPAAVKDWLFSQQIEFRSAAIALALCAAAYISEDLRSGIRSIASAQFEAARALGMSFVQTMRLVIVPQALRATVPPLVSQSLLLFKNTSLAMAIGLAELTYQTREIESSTFMTFEIYAICTVVYLAISFCIMGIGEIVERKYNTRGA
jgi:polar amino acid transport system permease protein